MSALETLSLACLTIGVAAILRFVWLDSLRFEDSSGETADPALVSHASRDVSPFRLKRLASSPRPRDCPRLRSTC